MKDDDKEISRIYIKDDIDYSAVVSVINGGPWLNFLMPGSRRKSDYVNFDYGG